MSASSIALNRFGLGARPGEAIVGDPAKWVMAQCDRFEPRPPVIASAPATADISTGLVAYYAQEKAIRAQFGPRTPKAALGMDGKPVVAVPTMCGAMSPAPVSPGVAPSGMAQAPMARGAIDPGAAARQEARQVTGKQSRNDYGAAVAARTMAALTGEAPFVERLVHF